MPVIDTFIESIKASWVPRILNKEGKWADVFKETLKKFMIPLDYVFKLNIKNIESFPVLKKLPVLPRNFNNFL